MTGITTITEDSNYGNRLQNYAVQSFLEKLGVEAGTIVYKTPFIRKLKNFVKNLLRRRKFDLIHKKRDAAIYRLKKKKFICIILFLH